MHAIFATSTSHGGGAVVAVVIAAVVMTFVARRARGSKRTPGKD